MGEKKGEEAAENKNVFMPVFRRFFANSAFPAKKNWNVTKATNWPSKSEIKPTENSNDDVNFQAAKTKAKNKKKYNKI